MRELSGMSEKAAFRAGKLPVFRSTSLRFHFLTAMACLPLLAVIMPLGDDLFSRDVGGVLLGVMAVGLGAFVITSIVLRKRRPESVIETIEIDDAGISVRAKDGQTLFEGRWDNFQGVVGLGDSKDYELCFGVDGSFGLHPDVLTPFASWLHEHYGVEHIFVRELIRDVEQRQALREQKPARPPLFAYLGAASCVIMFVYMLRVWPAPWRRDEPWEYLDAGIILVWLLALIAWVAWTLLSYRREGAELAGRDTRGSPACQIDPCQKARVRRVAEGMRYFDCWAFAWTLLLLWLFPLLLIGGHIMLICAAGALAFVASLLAVVPSVGLTSYYEKILFIKLTRFHCSSGDSADGQD